MTKGLLVTEHITGAHPKHPRYPLLPEDLLVEDEDGTFTKECPGVAVSGFVLTVDQIARLTPVEFWTRGLNYTYEPVA